MPEDWDLVPDSPQRSINRLTTFILFCEDKVSEPAYFNQFQKEYKVKINAAIDQKSAIRNIANTLHACQQLDLLEPGSCQYKIRKGIDTVVWCVFDRDAEHEDRTRILPENDIEFSLSVQAAANAGLNVAWSNDVFELWILLHFEDVTPAAWCHRNYVYDRLTEIFKTMPDPPAALQALIAVPTFNYKTFCKTARNFTTIVLPLLTSKREVAIARAKALEAAFGDHYRSHECNPCTKVHHLVESIMFCRTHS